MKYSINVNQLALSKFKKLDIKDAAILDFLKDFCASDDKNVDQMDFEEDGRKYRYTWINYGYLIEQMPLLQFKQTSSITYRLQKIADYKLIKIRTLNSEKNGRRKTYIRLTEKIKEITFYERGANNLDYLANKSRLVNYNNNRLNNNNNKSKKEEEKQNKDTFRMIMNYFISSIKEEYGIEPLVNYSRDGALLRRVLSKYKPDKVKRIIDFYLGSDKFNKHGPNLSVALSVDTINKWLIEEESIT
jgi:hypothetical protein